MQGGAAPARNERASAHRARCLTAPAAAESANSGPCRAAADACRVALWPLTVSATRGRAEPLSRGAGHEGHTGGARAGEPGPPCDGQCRGSPGGTGRRGRVLAGAGARIGGRDGARPAAARVGGPARRVPAEPGRGRCAGPPPGSGAPAARGYRPVDGRGDGRRPGRCADPYRRRTRRAGPVGAGHGVHPGIGHLFRRGPVRAADSVGSTAAGPRVGAHRATGHRRRGRRRPDHRPGRGPRRGRRRSGRRHCPAWFAAAGPAPAGGRRSWPRAPSYRQDRVTGGPAGGGTRDAGRPGTGTCAAAACADEPAAERAAAARRLRRDARGHPEIRVGFPGRRVHAVGCDPGRDPRLRRRPGGAVPGPGRGAGSAAGPHSRLGDPPQGGHRRPERRREGQGRGAGHAETSDRRRTPGVDERTSRPRP